MAALREASLSSMYESSAMILHWRLFSYNSLHVCQRGQPRADKQSCG